MTAGGPRTIDAPSPNHDGPRALTQGVVLHSTRGGAATVEAEFAATLAWFAGTASQVSAHVVIAADGTLARVVEPDLIAWHCRELNQTHVGVELVQPKRGDPITDAQYTTLAWWLRQMANRYGFALTAETLPQHFETVPGKRDGKTDIEPPFDKARLLGILGG